MPQIRKQNLTVSLSPETVQKAKVLAAKRSTSISGLIAGEIEALVDADGAIRKCAPGSTGFDGAGIPHGWRSFDQPRRTA
jgi:hypothetical protein